MRVQSFIPRAGVPIYDPASRAPMPTIDEDMAGVKYELYDLEALYVVRDVKQMTNGMKPGLYLCRFTAHGVSFLKDNDALPVVTKLRERFPAPTTAAPEVPKAAPQPAPRVPAPRRPVPKPAAAAPTEE